MKMLEGLAMYSDELMERLLSEEEIPADMIHTSRGPWSSSRT